MPVSEVHHPTNGGGSQESYLVEMYSIFGYSRSPVFVRPFAESMLEVPARESPWNTHMMAPTHLMPIRMGGPWLLGIDWGYINSHNQSDNNSGISGVVPAWHLLEMLNTERMKMQRRIEQQEELKNTMTTEC